MIGLLRKQEHSDELADQVATLSGQLAALADRVEVMYSIMRQRPETGPYLVKAEKPPVVPEPPEPRPQTPDLSRRDGESEADWRRRLLGDWEAAMYALRGCYESYGRTNSFSDRSRAVSNLAVVDDIATQLTRERRLARSYRGELVAVEAALGLGGHGIYDDVWWMLGRVKGQPVPDERPTITAKDFRAYGLEPPPGTRESAGRVTMRSEWPTPTPSEPELRGWTW